MKSPQTPTLPLTALPTSQVVAPSIPAGTD